MLKDSQSFTPPLALGGSLRDFRHPRGVDLQSRLDGFHKWSNLRRQNGLWADDAQAADAASDAVDFVSRDALGLSTHAAVKAAVSEALERFGAGAVTGAGDPAPALEARLAELFGVPEALLYPTPRAAGAGAIRTLVRSADHVLIDAHCHAGLREGAAAATRNIYVFRHNSLAECRTWLEKIRARDGDNGVMVVTEALFPNEGDTADLAAMQALCAQFRATMLVDATEDVGAFGPGGRGVLSTQDMLGKLDLVTAGFPGLSGGFVACRNAETKAYLRAFGSTAEAAERLTALQVSGVLKALDVLQGAEGEALRKRLAGNIESLRAGLLAAGFECHGQAAPAVCVKIGGEALARLLARRLPEAGLLAETLEFPAVAHGQARVRLNVRAAHTAEQIGRAVAAFKTARQAAGMEFEQLNNERDRLRAAG